MPLSQVLHVTVDVGLGPWGYSNQIDLLIYTHLNMSEQYVTDRGTPAEPPGGEVLPSSPPSKTPATVFAEPHQVYLERQY